MILEADQGDLQTATTRDQPQCYCGQSRMKDRYMDPVVVRLDDEAERLQWVIAFDCTEEELRAAVKTMGTPPDVLRAYIKPRRLRAKEK